MVQQQIYSRPYNKESSIYMKELANGWHGATEDWNTYCKAYYKINTEIRINLGAINAHAFVAIDSLSTPKKYSRRKFITQCIRITLCILSQCNLYRSTI